jgi:hypothetical protein
MAATLFVVARRSPEDRPPLFSLYFATLAEMRESA